MGLSARQVEGAATILKPFAPTAVGRRIEGTPEATFSAAAEYKPTWLLEGLALSGGVYYVGNQAINATNNAFIPEYTTYDLGASYRTELAGRPFTFRINGQNITDKRYWAGTGGLTLSEGMPATVKFSVSASL